MRVRPDHPLAGRDRLTVQQLREEGGRFAAYPPHGAPPTLLSLQGQLITGRSMDQLSFCDGLESLYTLVASGFACAVIAALPQVPLPGLRVIPLPELAPVSYGLSHRPGRPAPPEALPGPDPGAVPGGRLNDGKAGP